MRTSLFAVLWIALSQALWAAPACVAIISDVNTQDLGALVTSELSNDPNIALVERDALAKVGDELKLQQFASTDAVNLGKLLGADGLVFLSKMPDGIHARLTATGLGFVLFDLQLGADIHPDELAKLLANQVSNSAAKLKLSPTEAIPISILNLRSEYATYASEKTERRLTLLLESRLSSVPKIVVLERRHAWAVNFERMLVPGAAAPLIRGSYLLDGSLKMPSTDLGDIIANLRLQSPSGSPLALEIKGTGSDLPGLASNIEKAVVTSMGQAPTGPASSSQTEARAYLQEGIWAARNGLSQPALEALDSAELLGETAPDLLAVRIPVLCKLAAGIGEAEPESEFFLAPKKIERPLDPHPEERIDEVMRAIDDATRYAKGGSESSLVILPRPVPTLGTAGSSTASAASPERLTPEVELAASQILWMLHQLHHSREEELRQALRSFAGFDPLHHRFPTVWVYASLYTELWSESPDEVIAYYQSLAPARPDNSLEDDKYDLISQILLKDGPANFCSRFVQNPAERRILFDQLIDKLIHDPSTQAAGLFARATWAAPADKETAYQAILDYLSSHRQNLVKNGDLGIYLTSAAKLQRTLAKPANPKFIELLHYDLQNITEWQEGPYCQVWQPDLFPPADAPAFWKELEACKARTIAYETHHASADGKTNFYNDPAPLQPMFLRLENDYIQKFGRPSGLAAPPPAQATAASLPVTRAWHSWQAATNPTMPFNILGWALDDHETMWIYGYHDPYGSHFVGESLMPVTLFKVHLPDLQTETIAAPWQLPQVDRDSEAQIQLGPDDLYIYGVGSHLDHFKISTGKWERQDVTPAMSKLFFIGGKLYFSLKHDGGVARYDWDARQTIILADSRRRPAQNQFDDRGPYTVQDIFATADGKVCVRIDETNYIIQEHAGPWPPGPDFDPAAGYPSDKKEGISRSSMQNHGRTSTPTFPIYSKEWVWLQGMPAEATEYGFRDHDVFELSRHGFKLLWDHPYESAPLPIPLDLKMDDQTRALMASCYKFEFPEAIAPTTGTLHMAVSTEGICLFPYYNAGLTAFPLFWFVPFTDIDAYRRAHAADKRPTVFNPLSLLPPEVLKNIEASARAQRHPPK